MKWAVLEIACKSAIGWTVVRRLLVNHLKLGCRERKLGFWLIARVLLTHFDTYILMTDSHNTRDLTTSH
jgi:hypothetical protein